MSGGIVLDKRSAASPAGDMVQSARERMRDTGVHSDNPQEMLNELVAHAFAQQGMGPTTLSSLQGRVAALEIAVHSMADLRPWVEKLHNRIGGTAGGSVVDPEIMGLRRQMEGVHNSLNAILKRVMALESAPKPKRAPKQPEPDPAVEQLAKIRNLIGIGSEDDVIEAIRKCILVAERQSYQRGIAEEQAAQIRRDQVVRFKAVNAVPKRPWWKFWAAT